MESARFLIVGGGIAGVSAAWQLAAVRGEAGVMLVEGEPHLGMHSSARNAAILRTLSSDPITTRLAVESARFLREPPAGFAEVPLVDERGLVLSADEHAAVDLAAQRKSLPSDVAAEALSPSRLRELVPAFETSPAAALLFPRDGQIDIAALLAGFVRGARRAGASLRRKTRVRELLVEAGTVVGVRFEDGGAVRAETTILAAGGWSGRLAAAAGSRVVLRPTRRHLLITEPSAAIDPRWPVLWHLGERELYCRPDRGGLLLCACDIEDVDPDSQATDATVRAEIAARASQHLPSLASAGAAHFWSGVRTLTRDGRFAIGPDPDLSGLFWVAGLGGAGMTCSAAIGRLAADRLLSLGDDDDDDETARALDPARLVGAEGTA